MSQFHDLNNLTNCDDVEREREREFKGERVKEGGRYGERENTPWISIDI